MIVWGDTLSEIAQQYNVSVESLAEWNNIENVDLIYAGDEIFVEDPQKQANREGFEAYPEVNESSGWLMGEEGIQGTTASNMVELVSASLQNFDVVTLTGGLLVKIQNDPDMLAKQQKILNKIKANPRYKKEEFYITGRELVEFGGQRWSSSDENWGSIGGKNPALHSETWNVAKNELTWALRHATVKYWAEVSASGSITIQYRLNDRLDLSSSSGRSGAYNIISDVLGFGYHTIAGGNINLQTRAEWIVNF